jgi:glycogen debranching enzyme
MALTLVAGSTFCLSGADGDVNGGVDGLYVDDVRQLSRLALRVDGERLSPLGSWSSSAFSATFVLRTAPSGPGAEELAVVRERAVASGLAETIRVRNLTRRPRAVVLELELAADFADVFAVKEHAFALDAGESDPEPLPASASPTRLGGAELRFRDADGATTQVVLSRPAEGDGGTLAFRAELEPHTEWTVSLRVRTWAGEPAEEGPAAAAALDASLRELARSLEDWRAAAPTLRARHAARAAHEQSVADLAALRLRVGRHVLPAAGAPWFMTVFGRDSLIAGLQAVHLDPGLAAGALGALAELQADADDPAHDAEPGKILHELRTGKAARAWFGRYYGTVDATPLFLVALSEHRRWTGDDELARALRPNALRALAWIDEHGDLDGDGFVEYERRAPGGILNQSWKDSHDSQLFHDGTPAVGPIAPAEVQGYVYDAKLRTAELARAVWADEPLAERLEAEAAELRRRFDEAFWCERGGSWTYALALDGEKRPVNSLASNVGHLLWSGIAADERVDALVEQLFSPALWSGWGVRTMAADDGGYSPLSYHDGTVWPHDNSLVAWGLARHGRWQEVDRILAAQVDAAAHFDGRLPEVFAGFDRGDLAVPVVYPTASRPQAWAAGAIPLLVRLALLRVPRRPHR